MNRHDIAIRDDAGRVETLVTVTAMGGDEEQTEQYQTTEDIVKEALRDA